MPMAKSRMLLLYKFRWLLALFVLTVFLTADCFFRNRVNMADGKALAEFVQLPGEIGLRLDTEVSGKRLLIREGLVIQVGSIQPAPEEAIIYKNFGRPSDIVAPAGYYFTGPYLTSPNTKFVASALSSDRAGNYYQATAIAITNLQNNKEPVLLDGYGEWGVQAIAWAPNSRYVAVIRSKSGYGLCLMEILAYVFSHPFTLSNYYLDVIDLAGNVVATQKLMSRVGMGRVEVVWISGNSKPSETSLDGDVIQ